MSIKSKALGKWGEQTAKEYLIQKNIHIVDQNVVTKYGEIDLIGLENGMYIFFEIKTRRSKRFGYPEISIDTKKSKRLIESSQAYICENEIDDQNWRIDVLSILLNHQGKYEIKWFKNATAS